MSKVLDGKYKGWLIVPRRRFWLFGEERLVIAKFPSSLPLTPKTIKGWQALSESGDKDAMSMAGRALVGSFLLGPLGLLGGAATAKSKGTAVAIEFRNGKKSLVQLDPEMFAKFRFSMASLNYDSNRSEPPKSADTKTCPFCAETIKSAAVICKHCGKDLPSASLSQTKYSSKCPKCGHDFGQPIQRARPCPECHASIIVRNGVVWDEEEYKKAWQEEQDRIDAEIAQQNAQVESEINAALAPNQKKKRGCLRIFLYILLGLIILSILGNLAGKKNPVSPSSNPPAPAATTP